MNIVFIVALFYLVWTLVSKLFSHARTPQTAIQQLKTSTFTPPDQKEITEEIRQEDQEKRDIKKKSLKVSNTEIRTVEDIAVFLADIIEIFRKSGNKLSQDQVERIKKDLNKIRQKECLLKKGLEFIKSHVEHYKADHQKGIQEMIKRLNQTKDPKQKRLLQDELVYQKRMLEAFTFLGNESKLLEFTQNFNKLLYTAIQRLSVNPEESLYYLDQALKNLKGMRSIYSRQREIEKYLLGLNRHLVRDLNKERDR